MVARLIYSNRFTNARVFSFSCPLAHFIATNARRRLEVGPRGSAAPREMNFSILLPYYVGRRHRASRSAPRSFDSLNRSTACVGSFYLSRLDDALAWRVEPRRGRPRPRLIGASHRPVRSAPLPGGRHSLVGDSNFSSVGSRATHSALVIQPWLQVVRFLSPRQRRHPVAGRCIRRTSCSPWARGLSAFRLFYAVVHSYLRWCTHVG